ncbi:molybdenum cofactor guanylyltransferase [Marinomonas balearica]|uniref:Molybdenum cofactor guanylyltransferase n=1 Tax=Marinomonas balearica TaxID=491947 RepID=A0A4R6MIM2_9GAMM|nr:molybdenum cofactor guanylyltransferase [Marinomonas balearica]TDP01848.1 molybdenum cofactor guanylyltransferase [Marinomonas balearica]
MLQTDTSRVDTSHINNTSSITVAGLILSGGRGSRMGGVEKGLVDFQGKPMVGYAHAVLAPLCSPLLLSANRQIDDYIALTSGEIDIVQDIPEFQDKGPLSGILAGLERMQEPIKEHRLEKIDAQCSHLLISPCDTPLVPSELFQALISKAHASPNTAFYIQSDSGAHPLHAIIPTSIKGEKTLTLLRRFLQNNPPKVMSFYQLINAQSVVWPDESELANLNRSSQLPNN